MHYIASAHAYDVLDTVQITVLVQATEGTGETRLSTALRATTTVEGVGETDPRLWLTDVLVALIEAL